MSWKKRDDTWLLWAVIVLLIGTTILIGSHGIYKGIQLDLLHEEVRELRYQLNRLQVKEDEVEIEVKRQKRQVDLFSRPEVLDYAYNANLPDSDSELSVYDKWFRNSGHKMSTDFLNIIKSVPLGLGMTIPMTMISISLLVRNIKMTKVTEDTECLKPVEMTIRVILLRFLVD